MSVNNNELVAESLQPFYEYQGAIRYLLMNEMLESSGIPAEGLVLGVPVKPTEEAKENVTERIGVAQNDAQLFAMVSKDEYTGEMTTALAACIPGNKYVLVPLAENEVLAMRDVVEQNLREIAGISVEAAFQEVETKYPKLAALLYDESHGTAIGEAAQRFGEFSLSTSWMTPGITRLADGTERQNYQATLSYEEIPEFLIRSIEEMELEFDSVDDLQLSIAFYENSTELWANVYGEKDGIALTLTNAEADLFKIRYHQQTGKSIESLFAKENNELAKQTDDILSRRVCMIYSTEVDGAEQFYQAESYSGILNAIEEATRTELKEMGFTDVSAFVEFEEFVDSKGNPVTREQLDNGEVNLSDVTAQLRVQITAVETQYKPDNVKVWSELTERSWEELEVEDNYDLAVPDAFARAATALGFEASGDDVTQYNDYTSTWKETYEEQSEKRTEKNPKKSKDNGVELG